MRRIVGSIGRFPLLMGAIICFILALWEESHNTAGKTTVAIVALAIGAVLLGGWFYSLVIDAERRGSADLSPPREDPAEDEGPEGP